MVSGRQGEQVVAQRAARLEQTTIMTGSLIINARHRLAWHQRLFSDASTAMMWGCWLWLWSPLLRSSRWLADLGARSYPTLLNLVASGSADAIQFSVLALACASGALLVWKRLPARKFCRSEPAALPVCDYARHFLLPEHVLRAGRSAAVCVVRHDESGRIVKLECRGPATAGEAMAA